MGYEVADEGLRNAAKAARSAGDQVGRVKTDGVRESIGRAMPGSKSESAAGATARSWKSTLDSWRRDVTAYADSLTRSADQYAHDDGAARRDFGALRGN